MRLTPTQSRTSTAGKRAPKADRLFRAFADTTRLRILHLLKGRELCVCDLVAVIGSPQPTISRHLAYLRKMGLILGRKEGLWNHYRLAPIQSDLHGRLLDCLPGCLALLPDLSADAHSLDQRLCDKGNCCR